MTDTSLAKKMKRKSGGRAVILNASVGYEAAYFAGLEAAVTWLNGQFDWVQIFVKNKAELDGLIPKVVKALKPESMLWITFPKGTSKIQTDLTRDKGWDILQKLDLKWVNLVSVNETWSAFALRPYKEGEKRQSFRL